MAHWTGRLNIHIQWISRLVVQKTMACNIKVGSWSGNSINNCKFFVGSVNMHGQYDEKLLVETSLMISGC